MEDLEIELNNVHKRINNNPPGQAYRERRQHIFRMTQVTGTGIALGLHQNSHAPRVGDGRANCFGGKPHRSRTEVM